MSEYSEHKAIASYIKLQYPDVIFTSDSSGINLSIGAAKKMLALKSKCKILDLIILEPRGGFCGLIMELKMTGKTPFKKDGDLKKDDHLIGQATTISRLKKKGYSSMFAVGYDEAKKIIDAYLKLPKR